MRTMWKALSLAATGVATLTFAVAVDGAGAQSATAAPSTGASQVQVVNTAAQPVPTVAQGTTTVAGSVSVSGSVSLAGSPSVQVSSLPTVNLGTTEDFWWFCLSGQVGTVDLGPIDVSHYARIRVTAGNNTGLPLTFIPITFTNVGPMVMDDDLLGSSTHASKVYEAPGQFFGIRYDTHGQNGYGCINVAGSPR